MILLLNQQVASCYTSAQLQYNENLQTTTVVLESFLNPECQQFQDEVNLTVTFYNDWAPITFIQPRFNYSSFSQVVMTQTVITSTPAALESLPTFAELNISNLAYWTLVRVVFLGRQVAQMDRCFDQDKSLFMVQLSNFNFELALTQACLAEIKLQAIEFQYQFNQKAGTITILRDGTDQNCEVAESSIKCWNYDDYVDDIQQPFTTPLIKFFIPSDGVIYSTEIVFENVIIGRVGGFFENVQAQFLIDNFYIQFNITQNKTIQDVFANNMENFTKIIYRLTAEVCSTIIMFQFVQSYYDPNQNFLSQRCYDQECRDKLRLLRNNLDITRIYLDIASYTDMVMNVIVGSPGVQVVVCFRRVVTKIISETSFSVELEIARSFPITRLCTQMDSTMVVDMKYYSKNIQDLTLPDSINAVTSIKFDFDNPIVLFESTDTKEIQNLYDPDILSVITISGKGFTFVVTGYQVSNGQYSIVYYIVFTLAGIVVLLCLIDTILKLIALMNLLKATKKSRR
ncbi:hypothetical protein SS50377_21458 [Spironucleus salmonicida]|uniref:Transmembrane protein n=1 Tax=Spironucleus salmonicida TaxID=348837 RepID=V6LD47_9EUKA|nr:hypothetical protein SS50377_21458 [Spironucleus salmonicida]|eukprot:EST42420.1 Hypothetical protein SS50377_17976 [Spironucleus salmonicida]